MTIEEIINSNKGELFNNIPVDKEVVDTVGEWRFYTSVILNGPIVIGWLDDDSLFVFGADGFFIYDTDHKKITFEDYESRLKDHISDDNIRCYVKPRNIVVDIFGMRGGGGNLISKDNKWSLSLLHLAWNVVVPAIKNRKTNENYFLKLNQLEYSGYMYIGFSKSDKYFAIIGDGGIDIYHR